MATGDVEPAGVITVRAGRPMPDLSYRASIKSVDVEELVDLFVHRPVAWAIARAVYFTPVTPDQITWASLFVGVTAGVVAATGVFTGDAHLPLAGALLIASAVLDCADGQLARMRRTSSPFGRMLDGTVDAIVQVSVLAALAMHLWWRHGGPALGAPHVGPVWPGTPLPWLVLFIAAVASGSVHTTLYDHFKNVYLLHTHPTQREGCDDPADVEASYEARKPSLRHPIDWLRFALYRRYVPQQRAMIAALDPYIPQRYRDMPGYTPDGAARYVSLNRGLMRAWSFYGIGTHIFALGLLMAVDQVEAYVIVRLFLFNLGLAVLVPLQRNASREYFAALSPSRFAP